MRIILTKTITILSILTILSYSQVCAQEEESGYADTINLNEVVITGTMVRVNKNNIPMAVSVINQKQLSESSASSILPILNGRVPGLFVTERGITGFGVATNAAGQITMRGIGGNPTTGVLVLIDGHPNFMGLFGHPLADSYVASDVQRVEVIRGPASILYGTNAMGGVINIITKQPTLPGIHGNARVMYGSYNTQKYMANAGIRKDKISVFASLNHDQTNGHRPNSDFNINNGYFKLDYQASNHFDINSDFSIADFRTTDPGPDTVNASPGNKLHITRAYWAMSADNDFEKFSGSAKIYYNFGVHRISNSFTLPVDDGFYSKDRNYGFNVYESAKLFKGNNITIGADYGMYGGMAENLQPPVPFVFIDTTVYEYGIYGFVQQSLFDKLTLNAGIRREYHKVFRQIWVPSAGFAYQLGPATTWKASVSKGFRSPTIQELFFFNHYENLSPEHITSYETGISQAFNNQKLNLELTFFLEKGDNMIITVPLQGLRNAGSIDNKGVEFAANGSVTDNLSFNMTYSYIGQKSPVYATPKNHLYISGRYNLNKFGFTAGVEYVSHLDTDPSPATAFQTYTLLNAKVSYMLWKRGEIYISGDNLLGENYETLRYYNMPGATVFGGLNVSF